MNAISIFLAESGRVAMLQKDFPLYQGSYQNKLIDIYVPKSILPPQFTTTNASGSVVSAYATSSAVKIGMTYTAADGKIKTSTNYYIGYLRDITKGNVDYSMYEGFLPQAFTFYAGQGANAPTLIINVVNIQTDVTPNKVIAITTTQTCSLDVMPSQNLNNEPVIEPSEADRLQAAINSINAALLLKQDKTDDSIALTQFPLQKAVVGAINDVGGQVVTNTAGIGSNTTEISDLSTRVTNLESTVSGAETPIGQLDGATLPTNAELNAFVQQQVGREPRPNDTIIFVLKVIGQSNKNYRYIYYDGTTLWQGYEIPPLSKAGNGVQGTIEGTLGAPQNSVEVSILDGKINEIYYKTNNDLFSTLANGINQIDTKQQNIISGVQVVGKATKAIQDQNGNIINTTYAVANNYYTKQETDSKYLSASYTNIYHFAASGIVDDTPTTPPSGIQGTVSLSAVGEALIFNLSRVLAGNYNFNKNSTDNSVVWVQSNVASTLQFRLETYLSKVGQPNKLMASELTESITLTANELKRISIPSAYLSLGAEEIKANTGDTFIKKFYVITDTSTAKTLNWYCNSTYDSTFQLNAQSITFDLNTVGGLKSIAIAQTDWVLQADGTYKVVIPQTTHGQPPSANYIIYLQQEVSTNLYQRIEGTPTIDTNGNITFTSYQAFNCVLLVGSSLSVQQRGITILTNPTSIPNVDYNSIGAFRVIQTETATALTLPNPTDSGVFYTFFVSNDSTSTQDVNFNGELISPNSGMQFKWNGATWQIGEQPTDTDEVYDKTKSQLLSQTLTDMQTATSNANSEIQNLGNTKLSTDLGNVELDGLGEKVFDCDLNKYVYSETNSQTGVDLTSVEYDNQYGIVLVFDFTADNETITQSIPQSLNSVVDIKIALQQGSIFHTGCKLVLQPGSGVLINGAATAIELTADGYNGTLKPIKEGNWQFDKTSEAPSLTITDGNTSLETSTFVVDKDTSGLEIYKKPNQSNQTGIRIRPDLIAKTLPDNFYAKLSAEEYINPANGAGVIDGKIWGDDIQASESAYVYSERATKSVICEAVGDDIGTSFSLKFVADFGDITAESDGYILIYLQDNITNTMLNDDKGNPLGVKEYFKTGDKITRLVAYGIKTFSASTKVGFVVENGFNELLELTQDTSYSVQALQNGKQVSAGDNAFDIASGLRWRKQFRYYYNDLLKLNWLKNETVAEQTIATGAYNYNDGLHLDVISNPLKFAVGGGSIKINDDGTNLMFCSFGRVFDRIDTANLKGKTLNVAYKGKNKDNAWNIHLLTYTGAEDGQFTSQIVTGITNDTISFASGWTDISQIFIIEDPADEQEVDGTFTIPTTDFDRMAILLIPIEQQQPTTIEITNFNASLTNGFTDRELTLTTSVREEHLRYDNTYAKFQDDNQGFSSLRYTINATDTKLPFGTRVSGNKAVNLVNIWVDNPKLKGEGGLAFANKNNVTMRIRIPLHRGEGAVVGQAETTSFAIYKRQSGSDSTDIANPSNFNIANFVEIPGTRQDFVVQPTETDTFYINYIVSFGLVDSGSTIILTARTTNASGSYIYITPKMPLNIDLQGIEIV